MKPSIVWSRGDSGKPFSASSMAGWNSAAHGSLPCFACAIAIMLMTPGVPTESPPVTASMNASGLPSFMN